MRLDLIVAGALRGIRKPAARKLIDTGAVTVDGVVVKSHSHQVILGGVELVEVDGSAIPPSLRLGWDAPTSVVTLAMPSQRVVMMHKPRNTG